MWTSSRPARDRRMSQGYSRFFKGPPGFRPGITHCCQERVDLVDDLAHQVAHLVFVEARYLGPGQAPSFGIDHDNIGVVASLRYRRQAPVKVLQHRLPDAHQRYAPGKGWSPSSFPYFHSCAYPSVFRVAVDIRMSRAIRS